MTMEACGILRDHRYLLHDPDSKGEITRNDLSGNGLGQFCAAGVLSATPLTYSMQRDHSDFVVFCFSNSEDAEASAKRFGREPIGQATLKASGGDLIT
jgi:hypothetical protein